MIPFWKIPFFLVATLFFLYISRRSLTNPRSHGFFRFFAWEMIVLLFLLNVSFWLQDPFSWHQVISWLLLVVSIIPVMWGVFLLRNAGKPVEKRDGDPTLIAFENTSTLVTRGIFRYIRHPLYCSLLMLAWGIFFKRPSWIGFILVILTSGFLYLTARMEEIELIHFFGSAYQEYMKTSKRFVPFIF